MNWPILLLPFKIKLQICILNEILIKFYLKFKYQNSTLPGRWKHAFISKPTQPKNSVAVVNENAGRQQHFTSTKGPIICHLD